MRRSFSIVVCELINAARPSPNYILLPRHPCARLPTSGLGNSSMEVRDPPEGYMRCECWGTELEKGCRLSGGRVGFSAVRYTRGGKSFACHSSCAFMIRVET